MQMLRTSESTRVCYVEMKLLIMYSVFFCLFLVWTTYKYYRLLYYFITNKKSALLYLIYFLCLPYYTSILY